MWLVRALRRVRTASHPKDPVDPRLAKLTRNLRQVPDNKPVLYLLTHALRSTGELQVIAAMTECWMLAFQGTRPDLTLLKLYWCGAIEQRSQSAYRLVRALLRSATFELGRLQSTARIRMGAGARATESRPCA